jgi:hypothetical protein
MVMKTAAASTPPRPADREPVHGSLAVAPGEAPTSDRAPGLADKRH